MRSFIKSRIFLSTILILALATTALASDVILSDLNDKPVNLSSYKNKPMILFLWTSWCRHCRKEIKELNQMSAQAKQEGVTVLAINLGESKYEVRDFLKDYAITSRVLLDPDNQVGEKYRVPGIPTYIFISGSGEIISQQHNLPKDYKSLFLELKK